MANENVFSIEQIDLGLTYALQKKFIDAGHDVDPVPFLADEAGYNAALSALETPIRTFAPGSSINKGNIKEGNVYIMRKDILPGSIAYSNPVDFSQFDDSGTQKFQKNRIEDPRTIVYEVRYYTNNIAIERIITECIILAFRRIIYLPGVSQNQAGDNYEFTSFEFALHYINSFDLSNGDYMERLVRFEVRDVNVVPDQLIQVVPRITQIDVEIQPVKSEQTEGIEVDDPQTFPTTEKFDISVNN